jgi:hypothetical protein
MVVSTAFQDKANNIKMVWRCVRRAGALQVNYLYQRSRSFFRRTIGFVTIIAIPSPTTVSTSCTLLKFSLRTSNVPEGAVRVKKRSKLWTKTRDVDSNREGEVIMRRTFSTCRGRECRCPYGRRLSNESHNCERARGGRHLAAAHHTGQAFIPALR